MTLRDVLVLGTDFLKKKSVATPRLDCELMFAHALGMKRLDLYVRYDMPMEEKDLVPLRKVLARRAAGEPVAYIVGHKAFYGMDLEVGPGVLVPRPETDVMVDEVLDFFAGRPGLNRMLDLCAGSGAIGLAVAVNNKDVSVTAVEIDDHALAFCRKNVSTLGIRERFECLKGDLYEALTPDNTYDVIVSNPPYVRSGDWESLPPEVKAEPKQALLGGPDGLDVIRRIVTGAGRHLNPGGMVCIEIGDQGQADALQEMLRVQDFRDTRLLFDLARRPRAVTGIR